MIVTGVTIQRNHNTKAIMSASGFFDLIREFKKGIKRDANLFLTLGPDTLWDNFNQALVIEAQANNFYDVMDSYYFPCNNDARFYSRKKRNLW